ncbi:tRNA (guanosine(46)-N7)-methyltransferase TrmB [Arenimonas fontis]|uniref:tRNA (guanine-N(7)-)-methyltransferase n=1 Tax=Arenimonas fontis TaxID=2608255 RepID=A0A5B2ZDI0_9GAMM|nr:tRNA (guanosine(46)-N7)-methyltransferase TrmB [Arenimonas fontis]KAA2285284.1 tRNA (guanosine(46)-N7)-methyltransferase TrmB [Arenimonas fontis]
MSDARDHDPCQDAPRQRPIRSFVLRQGRQTEAQKRALELHWPAYGLDYTGRVRDFDAVFGRRAPRVVEIGFGNGEQLLFACGREPDRDFIGIEVHGPGVGRLLNGAAAARLRNLRVYQHDAVEVLRDEIAPGSLDEVRIYFPDPWPKKRHHKRRLLQPAFVALLCERLRPGGLLHLATDWQPYAEHMWEVLDAEPRLRNRAGPRGALPRPDWRRQTHFEARGLKLGHGVWDLLYDRLPE